MPRSSLAYMADVLDACDAIADFLRGVDLAAYRATPLARSAVERQLIIIGGAVGSLLRLDPALSDRVSHARRIVDFRNQLAHHYAAIDDAVVWDTATTEVPILRQECQAILAQSEAKGEAD